MYVKCPPDPPHLRRLNTPVGLPMSPTAYFFSFPFDRGKYAVIIDNELVKKIIGATSLIQAYFCELI